MVTEAEHAVATARRDGGAQAPYEGGSRSVIEDMEESAIENGVELLPERRQLQRVPHQEARLEAAVLRLALGELDGGRRQIDTRRLEAESGGHEGVLARPAASVQHASLEKVPVPQTHEGGLRAADVPWGAAGIKGVEPFCA